jgi:hypothetical protein
MVLRKKFKKKTWNEKTKTKKEYEKKTKKEIKRK